MGESWAPWVFKSFGALCSKKLLSGSKQQEVSSRGIHDTSDNILKVTLMCDPVEEQSGRWNKPQPSP